MFSLHFRQWSVKLSLFSPTIVQQSHDKGAHEAEKGAERGHPIFGATGHLRFQYGLLKWENNLNNFYNFEQRFAGTSPLRGSCRPRIAARETTMNNASPGQQGCCFPLLSRETCCKCYICCFPYSAGIVPAKVPFMEPLLYFVVHLAAGLQHAKRAKL